MTVRNRVAAAAVAAAVVGMGLTACGGGQSVRSGSGDRDTSGDTVVLGAVLPLTGTLAGPGDAAKLGIEYAVKTINAAGGIDGKSVKVDYADHEADPTKAVAETKRLLGTKGVAFLLGPLGTDNALAVQPVLSRADVVGVASAGGAALTPEKAPLGFSTSINSATQAAKMVEVALARNFKRIAILHDAGSQGKSAAGDMIKSLKKAGLEPSGVQEYEIGAADMAPQLLDLRRSNPQVVLLMASTGEDTGRVIQGRDQLNWEVPIIGGYAVTLASGVKAVAGDNAYKDVTAVTYGSFAACAEKDVLPATKEFVKNIRAFSPDRAARDALDLAAMFYDAVYLFKAALEETGSSNGAEVARWMEKLEGKDANTLDTVTQTFGSSASSHFLVGVSGLAVVNPGVEISDSVFQRADCK